MSKMRRDGNIKEAFIKYLQQDTDERFFQALTNFTQLPYIGAANTPDGTGFKDLWHVEGDVDVDWQGRYDTPQPPKEDKHELSDAQKAEIDEAVHVTIGKYGDTFKKLGDNDELALRSEIARICGLTPYRNLHNPLVNNLYRLITPLLAQSRKEGEVAGREAELLSALRNSVESGMYATYYEKRLAQLKQQQYEPSDYQKSAAKFNSDVQQQSELIQKEEQDEN